MSQFDIAIIGAGIAGASLAANLPPGSRVLLLEAEDHPGYHATGRSAAFWSETYGGPDVQPLTSASRAFLEAPQPQFAPNGFLTHCGGLHLSTDAQAPLAQNMLDAFAGSGVELGRMESSALDAILPGRRPGWDVGLWESDCCDIDAGALHNHYLAVARRKGVRLSVRAGVKAITRRSDGWLLDTAAGSIEAATIVNAAGAWADEVAIMAGMQPMGITPYRRTMLQLRMVDPVPESLPLVVGLDGSFYFKRESGFRIWLSPHDETASPPCDAAPDEVDVARAIDRLETVLTWRIASVERKWAGLRSFASDRLPVIGPSPEDRAFFWLAGQGGFGMQTAPAIAKIAASLLQGGTPQLIGVDHRRYLPDRLH